MLSIVEEFRRYLPGMLAGRGRASESDILTDWAFEVSRWRQTGGNLWLKQLNYEQLLDHHHNPSAFLAGLECLLGLLEPLLLSDEGATALFGQAKEVDMFTALHRLALAQAGKEVDRSNDPPVDSKKMQAATAAGVNAFRKWIKRRQRPAHAQLVEELRTIQFVESDDESDKWGGPLLTIPLLSDKDEAEYPAMLLRRFDNAPRPRKSELRQVLHQLHGLMNLPLTRVINHEKESLTGVFHLSYLPGRYPDWYFAGLVERHIIHAHWLTPRLWQELVWSFVQRIKWAWRFYNQVASLLNKQPAPYPLPRESPSAGDLLLDKEDRLSTVSAGLPQTRIKASREVKTAKLFPGIAAEKVRELLSGVGMGGTYTKPGEWAAALRGLNIAGILEGNAPEVTRWANGQGYIELSARETIKRPWSGEWKEAGQFVNRIQSSVFSKTIDAANKLLTLNKLSHNNE